MAPPPRSLRIAIHLQLARTPVVAVSAVSLDSTLITDYSIADPDRGWLYRRAGWAWTAQTFGGLSGGGSWLEMGSPLPRQEEPLYSVAYTAGYILPGQFLSLATISAAVADSSFNDSASRFPTSLRAGDIVDVSGFVAAANNARFVVSGTPTVSKIIVAGTLTTEAAGPTVAIKFRPPANCLPFEDVEKAAIETVKSWYAGRRDDSNVAEKQVGPMRVRYERGGSAMIAGLPANVVGLLRPWVRVH